ncbi:MAG: DUF4293 domain-containing protein [Bacteroidaceae bacterium]|nr:DUF4293 domain-containing protein [Bacteroidaceae bacterium]
MLQRIQTVYLLIAIAAAAALYFVPLAATAAAPEAVLSACTLKVGSTTQSLVPPVWMLAVFLALGIALRLAAVFRYSDRRGQQRLCRSAIVADVCWCALLAADIHAVRQALPESEFTPVWTAALMVLPVLFTLLAIRGIRHDERLVRAADRLR